MLLYVLYVVKGDKIIAKPLDCAVLTISCWHFVFRFDKTSSVFHLHMPDIRVVIMFRLGCAHECAQQIDNCVHVYAHMYMYVTTIIITAMIIIIICSFFLSFFYICSNFDNYLFRLYISHNMSSL